MIEDDGARNVLVSTPLPAGNEKDAGAEEEGLMKKDLPPPELSVSLRTVNRPERSRQDGH